MSEGLEFPAEVVLVERCRHCGDDGDGLQHGEGGHRFEARPLPGLPVGVAQVLVREDRALVREDRVVDGSRQLVVTARHRGLVARVWSVTGANWNWAGGGVLPTAAEWERVELAARVLLARMLCPHVDGVSSVTVVRLTDDTPAGAGIALAKGFHAHIRTWCADCGEPMVFVGDELPVGLSPKHPTVDVEGTTLLAPLRPASTGPGWGTDRPGFRAVVR